MRDIIDIRDDDNLGRVVVLIQESKKVPTTLPQPIVHIIEPEVNACYCNNINGITPGHFLASMTFSFD